MPTRSARLYSIALLIGDFVTLLLAFGFAYIVRVQFDSRPLVADIPAVDFFLDTLIIVPMWLVIFAALGLYSSKVYSKRMREIGKLMIGSFIGILIVLGYAYVRNQSIFPARLAAVYALVGSFVLLVLMRQILYLLKTIAFHYGHGVSRVLLVGNSDATKDIAETMSTTHRSGYKIVALAGPKRLIPSGLDVVHFSSFDAAFKQIKELGITTIIQTDLYDSEERNQRILGAAQINHIQYNFIPGEAEFYTGKNSIDVFLGYPLITVSQTPLVGWGAIFKRLFDLSAIVISAPLWVPFMVLVIILQKLFNPGPLFFNSRRLGLHGATINTYKFRSMKAEYSGQDAAAIFRKMNRPELAKQYEKDRKIDNDPRVTWFGNILRRTSIDELPQLFNVIKGELSLVGPRPILKEERSFYSDRAPLLFSVRPGMSGLWQVSGRSNLSFEKRVELELYYAQNWSFWLDIKILFKTIQVLFQRGAAR